MTAIQRDILVRVVSYRDDELLRTIASAWENASDAARVKFAIVNQTGPETAAQLDGLRGEDRVRSVRIDWPSARGLGWARRMTDRMRRDEAYSLQIDSHMRFAPGWDDALISQWEALRDERGVLSCYPAPYENVDDVTMRLHPVNPHLIVPAGEDADGMPRQDGGRQVAGGTAALLVSGGFQFSSGEVCTRLEQVREVMIGDEFVRALQLFTHGWNVYAPDTVPLYHLYRRDKPAHTHGFVGDFASTPETARTYDKLKNRSLDVARRIMSGDGAGYLGEHRSRAQFVERLGKLTAP